MRSLAGYNAINRELKKDPILLDIHVIPVCHTEGHTPIHPPMHHKIQETSSASISQS